jgi:hypothetical protein
MTKHTITWDWKEQPPIDELASAVRRASGGTVEVVEVDTGGDEYQIEISGDANAIPIRAMVPAILAAIDCIPDGEIRKGCHVHDGAKVRKRLKDAYLAARANDAPPTGGTDTGAKAVHG